MARIAKSDVVKISSEEQEKKKRKPITYNVLLVALVLILLFSMTTSIMLGPVSISPWTVWKIAFSKMFLTGLGHRSKLYGKFVFPESY